MRLIHTADVHLRRDRPATIEALDAVLAVAEDHSVDLVTIGGDLFDRPADVDDLRPELRARFDAYPGSVLLIPGNHDADAFGRNLDFGRGVTALVHPPAERWETTDAVVVGVPYTDSITDELYRALVDRAPSDRAGVLLLHCTLDGAVGRGDVGDDEPLRYCPVGRETLAHLGYDVVLAGHVHRTFDHRRFGDGTHFVYPGSPVSHGWDETGRRQAALVDTDRGTIEGIPLDTVYRERGRFTVAHGAEAAVIEEVGDWVDRRVDEGCEYEVVVEGFVSMPEQTFRDRVETVAGGGRVRTDVLDVREVVDHELYQRFVRRLDERETVDDREAVEQLLIRALGDEIRSGEVRP